MNDEEDDDELDKMQDLIHEGRGLDLDAAGQLELAVRENPADIESRIKLLGNYFTKWRVQRPFPILALHILSGCSTTAQSMQSVARLTFT